MEIGEKAHPIILLNAPKIKINDIKHIMMMWPASMFAKSRIINANGLVNMPSISTGIKIGFTNNGTGGLIICAQ